MDIEILSEQVLSTISNSAHPLSAKDLKALVIECDAYQLRSALFRLREKGEVRAELEGDTLRYSPLQPGEEPQKIEGLTRKSKNGNGINGHKVTGHKPNGRAAKEELLSIIEAMTENPIIARLVRLYGSL
jgi:hypothetical protein